MNRILSQDRGGEDEMRVLAVTAEQGRGERGLQANLSGPGLLFDAATLSEAREFLLAYDYDAILLLVSAPAVLSRLRRDGVVLPVLVCGVPDSATRTALLEAGADDVVSSACVPDELRARLRAIARRFRGQAGATLKAGEAELRLGRMEVSVYGHPVALTPKEYAILELLFLRPGVVHSKSSIVNHVYGAEEGPALRTLDVIVCKLRKKLSARGAPDLVATVWGSGLTLRAPPDTSCPEAVHMARTERRLAAA